MTITSSTLSTFSPLSALGVAMLTGMLSIAAAAAAFAVQDTAGSAETPFACNLKALTPAERAEHQQVTTRMLASIQRTREVADGYAFDLDVTHLSIKDLATWVDFERRCCPFFDFQVDWRRERGPVTLQLTGRTGIKDFIRVEFKPAFR
jgi:hypothetical protein